MELGRIKELVDAMAASGLAEMELTEGGWTLRLVRRPAEPAASPPPQPRSAPRPPAAKPSDAPSRPSAARADAVRAPLSGVLHLRPGPDAADFVAVGQTVAKGAPVCIVEAMKMFHEVRAERDGVVAEILVRSGDEVEAGQAVMRIV